MKKVLMFICIILTSISIAFPANAEESAPNNGSFNIPDDIMEQLPLKEGDQVIRSYNATVFYTFFKYETIDEVFSAKNESSDITENYIVISSDGSVMVYEHQDDALLSREPSKAELAVAEWYLNEKHNLIYSVDSKIVVENVYYFNGCYPLERPTIYFETILGDYVYYKFWDHNNETFSGELLASAESFHQIMVAYVEWIRANDLETQVMGSILFPEHFDLSAYQTGSPNFDPNAPFPSAQENTDDGSSPWLIVGICGGICVIAGVAAFLIVRKKKKNAMI